MVLQNEDRQVILASASAARSALLANAGLTFDIAPADIDEQAIRDSLDRGSDPMPPADIASMLAQAKAVTISQQFPDALVIGADQVLVFDGMIYAKPDSRENARDQLIALRGNTHELISAVACASDGEVDWYHEDVARLKMRRFSNAFLGNYLAAAGDRVLSSVGAYQLEGPGAQLFSSIEGDYFTILGLPLMALLEYLRTREILIE